MFRKQVPGICFNILGEEVPEDVDEVWAGKHQSWGGPLGVLYSFLFVYAGQFLMIKS